jgi:hypothetical protein
MTPRHQSPDPRLETQLRQWLHDEPIEQPPSKLHERLLAIPHDAPAPRGRFGGRVLAIAFSVILAVVVTVGAIALVNSNWVGWGLLPDCGSDADALLEDALASLDQVEGYRWTEEEQTWGFDPALPVSASDPRYAWSGYEAEGAYLSPDRMRVATTDSDQPERFLGPWGFSELIHIGGTTWAYTPGGVQGDDGEPLDWQELPPSYEVYPNRLKHDFSEPSRLDEMTLAPATLSWELPGSGGCEVVRSLEDPAAPNDADPVRVVIGVRIDAQGRMVAGAFEWVREDLPPEERMGDIRYRFEITFETPDGSEFTRPDGPIYTHPPESIESPP